MKILTPFSPLATFNYKIRSLQLINHGFMIFGLILASYYNQLSLLWLSLLFYVLFMPGGTVVGLHRLLSHKSFKTSKFWEYTLSLLSIFGTVGSTITWVSLHRLHHATSDQLNDPHSPYTGRGPGEKLKFTYWQAFKAWTGLWDVVILHPRYVIDLIHNSFHVFLHKNYFKIIFFTCALLAVIDPWLVLFVYIIPACGTLHATSIINVIAHAHGYKSYETNDESRNSWIGNLVTLGDGWHNTHHANPGKWYYRERWWEWDLCGEFIKFIRKDV